MRRDAQAQNATTLETVVGFSMSGLGALPTGRLVRQRAAPARGVEVMASKTSRSTRAGIKWPLPAVTANWQSRP